MISDYRIEQNGAVTSVYFDVSSGWEQTVLLRSDVSVKNPNRICESCGMKHVHSCPKMNEEKPMLKSQNSRFVLVFVSFFVITISIGGYFANKNGAFGFYSLLWTGILVAFILMISVSSWIGRGD